MENKNTIYNYPVLIFAVLTFLISWGAILLFFGAKGVPATDKIKEQVGITILLGPTLASIILISIYKGSGGFKELISRLLHWRLNVGWYLLAILFAPLVTVISIFIFSFFFDNFQPAIFNSSSPFNLISLGIIGGLMVGLFEEVGWTGFATPYLRKRYGILTTGVIIGLIWGAWHFILFWEDDSFTQNLGFALLVARLFSWLPAYRIIMVWIYDKTNSLLILILMHTGLVLSLITLDPIIADRELLIFILIRALILWIIVTIFFVSRKL